MAKKPSLSSLRHRVIIEQLTNVADGQGGFTTSWTTLDTLWGSIEPVKSSERMHASRTEYQRSHVCYIRHRSDVTTSMRISFDSRIFQIKGIIKPLERTFYLVMDLEENQA